jgi:hypothetical protein
MALSDAVAHRLNGFFLIITVGDSVADHHGVQIPLLLVLILLGGILLG